MTVAVRRRGRLSAAVLLALATLSPGMSGAPRAQTNQPAIGCDVDDFNLALRLYIPMSNDGYGIGEMRGSLEILHQKVPKEDRVWSLDGKRPLQFWKWEDEMRLMLVMGPPNAPLRLVIDTTRRQFDPQYRGTFRLEIGTVKLTGRLACFAG